MPQITLSRLEAQRLVDFCTLHKSESFFIAKDDGAYLGYSVGEKPEQQCIFYFKGCDPKLNPDTYWETGQRMFGGDDFGEHIKLRMISEMLARPQVTRVTVKISPRQIRVEGIV